MIDMLARLVLPFALGAVLTRAYDKMQERDEDDVRPRVLDLQEVKSTPAEVIDASGDIYDDLAGSTGVTDGSLSLVIDLRTPQVDSVSVAAMYAPEDPDIVFLLPGLDADGDPISTTDPAEAKAAVLAALANATPVPMPVGPPPLGMNLSPDELQRIRAAAERRERQQRRQGALGLLR